MPFAKLRGRIREVYQSETLFAAALGVSKSTLSAKLNGKQTFGHDELIKCIELLDICPADINDYFFAQLIKKN